MKYINAKNLLPDDLLEIVQEYTQGNYIYIPKKDGTRDKWGSKTSYNQELLIRNKHIHTDFLRGYDLAMLSKNYCLSVKSIRRILFSYKKEADKMKDKLQKLLSDNWNIEQDIFQIYPTAWSVGNDYVIKVNNNFAKMKRNIAMIKVLNERNIPVAVPIPTLSGEDYIECEENFCFLSKKLSGKEIINIFDEKNYLDIAGETGRIIANLHKAFLSCEDKVAFWNNSLLEEMKGWISNVLEENNYKYVSLFDLEESISELEEAYDKLPKQLIHRDIYYGNILFNNIVNENNIVNDNKSEFCGYIDFDLSQKNIRIFDICYFLMGLLVNRYQNKEYIVKWKEISKEFLKAYDSLNTIQKQEKESMCNVMKCIELLFTAYFIKEKDEVNAKSSAELYYFIRENETEITDIFTDKC